MLKSIHPIRLISRTEGDLVTIFHSFFLLECIESPENLKVVLRIPQEKPNIDAIESGLNIFISENLSKSLNEEKSGSFVVTISDGSRYYSFFRSFESKVIVAVSKLSNISICRQIFDFLEYENSNLIKPILLTLTEIPIYPWTGIEYCIEFAQGKSSIVFSSADQIVDIDMDLTILSIFTPNLLVKAWESILLEQKVLVVSKNSSIIVPCCEFLKRLILPFPIVNTYVPLLPIQLINTIEAPFPYLLGANSILIKENNIDLSETVVIDLDLREIFEPIDENNNGNRASDTLIVSLINKLNNIMNESVGIWYNRPSHMHSNPYMDPSGICNISNRVTQILKTFIDTNILLVSSRNCKIKAFYRAPEVLAEISTPQVNKSKSNFASLSFNFESGIYSGFMQLLKDFNENVSDDELQRFIPCWVELDDQVLTVYEFADDVPLLYVGLKDIQSVSPSAMEPSGHVFELTLKSLASFKFITTDIQSRQYWISAIDGYYDSTEKIENSAEISKIGDEIIGHGSNSASTSWINSAFLNINEESLKNTLSIENSSFRSAIWKTQMMSSFNSSMECPEYDALIRSYNESSCDGQSEGFFVNCLIDKYLQRYNSKIVEILNEIDSNFLESTQFNIRKNCSEINESSSDNENFDNDQIEFSMSEFEDTLNRNDGSLSSNLKRKSVNFIQEKSISEEISITVEKPKPKNSIMNRFTLIKKRFHSESKIEVNHKDQIEKNHEELAKQQKQQKKKRRSIAIQKKVDIIENAYKRCQSELNNLLVEARLDALKNITNSAKEESWVKGLYQIKIPIHSIVTEHSDIESHHEIQTTEANIHFKNWYEFIWYSLTDENWDEYKSRNTFKIGPNDDFDENMSTSTTPQKHNSFSSVKEDYSNQEEVNNLIEKLEKINTEKQILSKSIIYKRLSAIFLEQYQRNENLRSTKVVQVLLGYLNELLDDFKLAIDYYSDGFIVNQHRVMRCLLKHYFSLKSDNKIENDNNIKDQPIEYNFLSWSTKVSPILGVHSLKLLLELSNKSYSNILFESGNTYNNYIGFKSFRYFTGGQQDSHKKSDLLRINQSNGKSVNTNSDFSWVQNEAKFEAVNEIYTCIKLNVELHPCDVSIQLLSRLRELVKSYCQSPSGVQQCQKVGTSDLTKLTINQAMIDAISSYTAYEAFEISTCQLQKLSLDGMTINQRLLFFVNIYNTLTVHSILSRGSPGSNILERTNFMRNSKYNIAGSYFSLLDIEHGILRSSSTKPMIFGPLTISINFGGRDPRKKLILEEPRPNVSFCLFTACNSSPSLSVLMNENTVEDDMKILARKFLNEYITLGSKQKSLILPELLKIYWADFGGKKDKVMKTIINLAGHQFSAKLKPVLLAEKNLKFEFSKLDWTPVIIIQNI